MTPEIQRAASDVKPTMTDQAVLDFCKTGLLMSGRGNPGRNQPMGVEIPRPGRSHPECVGRR